MQDFHAVVESCFGVGLECSLGRGHRHVNIGGTGERDGRNRLFVSRIDDREIMYVDGVHPFPIDIELPAIFHTFLLNMWRSQSQRLDADAVGFSARWFSVNASTA